jgi:CheY-like chemotaxis protein
MRHRVLVVAQDVMLRSTLARWLMSAGYSVEVAENERRAREVLADHADHNVALTILAASRSVAAAFGLDGSCGNWIVVTDQSYGTAQLGPTASAANGCLSIPLDEQAGTLITSQVIQCRYSA